MMATPITASIGNPVNNALFATRRLGRRSPPPRRFLFDEIRGDWPLPAAGYVQAMAQSKFRCAVIEWHRDGRGRIKDGASRSWLPVADLVRSIEAMPVPVPMFDPVFVELWDWAGEHLGLSLEMEAAGGYLLRDEANTVVARSSTLQGVAEYMEAVFLATGPSAPHVAAVMGDLPLWEGKAEYSTLGFVEGFEPRVSSASGAGA